MPNNYRVTLRLLATHSGSTEDSRVGLAITAGRNNGVTGQDNSQLNRSHRIRNSDTEYVWNVRGEPRGVFGMLAQWICHPNVAVSRVEETQIG
jgi:hypothetical protein